MKLISGLKITALLLVLSVLLHSCSVSRFVPEGQYMLDRATIVSDSSSLELNGLSAFIRQHPNSKWFNLVKVPMLPYALSSTDSTKAINRFLWRIGEAPVIEDTLQTARCARDIQSAVRNQGYLDAEVRVERKYGKHKVDVAYRIDPKTRYEVELLETVMPDEGIERLVSSISENSLLYEGMPFDMNVLDAERSRINSRIVNSGYYRFNKEYIRFEADTTETRRKTWLRMVIDPYRNPATRELAPHSVYRIGKVSYEHLSGGSRLRSGLLSRSTHIVEGERYSESDVQSTYNAFGALQAVFSTNIRMVEDASDSLLLNPVISYSTNSPNSFSAELEGTNSAGDLGAALALTYQNSNVFRGSEVLGIKVRGAFENIRGLDGYDDQDFIEYSVEASLKFPDFVFPVLSHNFRRKARTTTEFSLMYDSQDRPEFHRRVVSGTWRYRWTGLDTRFRHRVDLIDLNYVYMPWISSTFKKEYLDNPNSRNAILRYNYENLFIMKLGYNFNFSSLKNGQSSNYGTNAYNIRLGVETAGNLLYGLSHLFQRHHEDAEYYKIFNIAYAQYAKVDFDFSKSFRFDDRNSLAMHFALGVAVPYGNGRILPYEKRYFAGGANSVRGWSVRSLGPGRFKGHDGRIDFINQTGDMKLDMNLEYRTHLFWKVDGAVFLDAGNIWTLRDYEEQPGGKFAFDTFWKQIALAYGAGLRFNFNFFILRFDAGVKAINPAYENAKEHFPIIYPKFKRDFTLHFAVGLPF